MTNEATKKGEAGRFNKIFSEICRWFFWSIFFINCLTLLFLMYWMIVTAFKNGSVEYAKNPFGLPSSISLSSFKYVFEKMNVIVTRSNGDRVRYDVFNMLGTSLMYAAVVSLIHVFFTSLMAYVIARYKFFGRNFLFMFGILLMITPIIGSMPSAMVVKKALGVYDNIWLAFLTSPVGCFYGMHFMILYSAFKTLPWSYAEAVFIDGGGHYTVLLKVMLPMMLPTMTVIYVLSFLTNWNDYQTFLIWLPSSPNLALGVYFFQNGSAQYGATMPEIMAGFLLVSIPTAALFLLSQKIIMSKFTVGGLKG
jgi:ABC-type glycerol-3-phosphate transport system permease component